MGIAPGQLPRFEVASVKKFEGRVTSSNLRTPGGGRISITNLPLRTVWYIAAGLVPPLFVAHLLAIRVLLKSEA